MNVYINQEKRFAFVEMRTVEEASNAMALDGIIYEVPPSAHPRYLTTLSTRCDTFKIFILCLILQGVSVRVRRPSDYNPSMAATLGPSQPSAQLNLANVGLTPGYVPR